MKLMPQDRCKVLVLSFSVAASAIIFFHSIKLIETQFFSLPILIVFGGLAPCIMNLKIRIWISFECSAKMYIDNPTTCGLVLDFINLVIVVLSVALSITICPDSYENMVSIGLACASGILLGIGLAEVRILCSFKTVRDRLRQ